MEFLLFCENRLGLTEFAYPADKAAWLPRIAEYFPHFQAEYEQAVEDIAKLRSAKDKFNGEWVAKLTGLQGKELGALMKRFKESFESPEAQREFVLGSSQQVLAERVRAVHSKLLQETV